MRLHTNVIDYLHLLAAASVSEVGMDTYTEHRSTIRTRAFEIHLVGTEAHHSARRPNSGRYGHDGREVYAATWDQWGVFLRHLFEIDPTMVCGSPTRPVYGSLTAFTLATDGRFRVNAGGAAMFPRDEHGDHHWQPGSDLRTRECSKCSARQIFPV